MANVYFLSHILWRSICLLFKFEKLVIYQLQQHIRLYKVVAGGRSTNNRWTKWNYSFPNTFYYLRQWQVSFYWYYIKFVNSKTIFISYLMKTYSHAFSFTEPHIVIFLGDLMDEGSIATETEYKHYLRRIFNLFLTGQSADVRVRCFGFIFVNYCNIRFFVL